MVSLFSQASSINNTNIGEQTPKPPPADGVSSAVGQPPPAWVTEPSQQERQLAPVEADDILSSPPLAVPHKPLAFQAESVEKKRGKLYMQAHSSCAVRYRRR